MGYLTVTYDGFVLNDYCTVLDAFPYVAAVGEGLKVSFNILIKRNVMQNLDKLNQILFQKEPKRLYISDFPHRYLLCKFEGPISLTSRFTNATVELTFVSDDPYWKSDEGEIMVEADSSGKFEMKNDGTYPCIPKFKVEFTSESGFFAVTGPNGYIALGDKDEKNRIELPKQEVALNEKLDTASIGTFSAVNNSLLIPDYQKLSLSSGVLNTNSNGLGLSKATMPKDGYYWNCVGYEKNFLASTLGTTNLDNFKLNAKLKFYDASGTTKNTGMYLIVLMTADNQPVMTTSIYNVEGNTNEVIVTAKINSLVGDKKSSKIIKTGRFVSGYDGTIEMRKEGSLFSWSFDSGKFQSVTYSVGGQDDKFNVGNTVYIKTSARYGYHDNGNKYSIAGFTRGRPNIITGTRKLNGKTQYLISYAGVRIYWMDQEDLTKDRSGVGQTKVITAQKGQRLVEHDFRSEELAQLKPNKVMVLAGVWDKTSPFTMANLSDLKITRINGENKWKEIINPFDKGDILTINNYTGDIMLNDAEFKGLVDYDSRFFDIDFGLNELQMTVSDWATMPKGKLYFEERFR